MTNCTQQSISSPSSVVLRFRLPKANTLSTAVAQQRRPASMDTEHMTEKRVCKFCPNTFFSKKDLRRHLKKVHNYHHHHHASKEEMVELTTSDDSSTACSLCGKTFTSYRALCGHMRTHPERERQRIKPPTTPLVNITPRSGTSVSSRVLESKCEEGNLKSSCSTSMEVPASPAVFNLTWGATARRGRKSLANLKKHGLIPLMVDNGPLTNLGTTHEESAPPQSSPPLPLLENPGHDVPEKLKKRKEKEPLEIPDGEISAKKQKVVLQSNMVFDDGLIAESGLEKGKPHAEGSCGSRVAAIAQAEVNEEVVQQKLHTERPDDNKDWGSFLSLGISGDLKQVNQHASESEHAADTNDMGRFLSVAVARKKNKNLKGKCNGASLSRSASSHRCEICDQSFPTGWALGGHKRLHWVAPHVRVTSRISSLVSQEQVNSRLLVAS